MCSLYQCLVSNGVQAFEHGGSACKVFGCLFYMSDDLVRVKVSLTTSPRDLSSQAMV